MKDLELRSLWSNQMAPNSVTRVFIKENTEQEKPREGSQVTTEAELGVMRL